MDQIPLEILNIIFEIPEAETTTKKQLSQYAAVSRKWQMAVERILFRSLKITDLDLDTLAEVFDGKRIARRSYLQILYVRCIFPHNGEDGCCHVTTMVSSVNNSNHSSKFIRRLFSILHNVSNAYEAHFQPPPPFEICFLEARGNEYPSHGVVSTYCSATEHSIREIELASPQPGTIELYNAHELPSLPFISSFQGHAWAVSKYLSPTWIGGIVKRFPLLREIKLYLEDGYNWGSHRRKQYQHVLATSLLEIQSSHLETVYMRITMTRELENEDVPVHRLSTPGLGDHVYDIFFRHLTTFSNLRFIYFTGPLTVSPQFFDVCKSSTPQTIFPHLEEFALEFTPATSDGRWFYERDELAFANAPVDSEYESDDNTGFVPRDGETFYVYGETPARERAVSNYNQYRSLPNVATFTPFLISAAEVCARMPKIKQFSLKLNNNRSNQSKDRRLSVNFVDRIFELWYLSANTTLEKFHKIAENPVIPIDCRISRYNRVYFRVGEYQPDHKIVQSWREVVGHSGKINFLEESHCWNYQPWCDLRMQYTGKSLQET